MYTMTTDLPIQFPSQLADSKPAKCSEVICVNILVIKTDGTEYHRRRRYISIKVQGDQRWSW